jgi:S1-C subfamily serine protease
MSAAFFSVASRSRARARAVRSIATLASTLGAVLPFSTALAQTAPTKPVPTAAVAVSGVVLRASDGRNLGFAEPSVRWGLLEGLRKAGFHGVGDENPLFGKDETASAEYLIGATVRELECVGMLSDPIASCRIGVEWQLFDVAADRVVYAVTTRVAVLNTMSRHLPTLLMNRSLESLIARDRFRDSFGAAPKLVRDAPTWPAATFASCAPLTQRMPEASEAVLNGTVLVRTRSGHGSGFFVSSDGLVLTAAHVVRGGGGSVKLRLRDGAEIDAVAARVDEVTDVALLRPARPVSGQQCLSVPKQDVPTGAEVYVVGAPADSKLAFSLTRGIVSGRRVLEGREQLQTDASVSPGNSGGPLIDGSGALVGVVTSKLTGGHVEGIAFAVPMAAAFKALHLAPGSSTDPALLSESAKVDDAPKAASFVDSSDPVPSLDPWGDAQRGSDARRQAADAEYEERRADRTRRTPGYVWGMWFGGIGLAVGGAATIGLSTSAAHNGVSTRSEYRHQQIYNTIGWVGVGGGVALIVGGFVARPPLAPPKGGLAFTVGPGSAQPERDLGVVTAHPRARTAMDIAAPPPRT